VGSQIQIAGSQNVEVTGNTIAVGAEGGNDIALIQQRRCRSKYGPWKTRNNWVHHNDVTYLGEAGTSGAVADHDEEGLLAGDNRFDYNAYHFSSEWSRTWYWGEETDWSGLRPSARSATARLTTTLFPLAFENRR
jgi:hypothetical protein